MDDVVFDTPLELTALLEGTDTTTGIVAVEPAGVEGIAIYRRLNAGDTVRTTEPFRPWLLAARPEPWSSLRPMPEIERLDGDHPLRFLIRFPSFGAYVEAARAGRESRETFFDVTSSVDQFLMETGRTLFKGMTFVDLRRLQLDIETTGLDPHDPASGVIVVSLAVNGGAPWHLDARHGEAELLAALTQEILRVDPDVVEGHNIFNFDLPFLVERAGRHGVALTWGRDGSVVRLGQRQQRVKVGPLSHPFRPAFIHGRHVIDTYQQIQRYDIAGRLQSYGLKPAVEALGRTRPNRAFVPGDEIAQVWREDPDRVIRYALDDALDVDLLSRLALPTEFYQTRLLPRSLQSVATAGPGSKINDLMVRAYLARRQSIPLPRRAEDYPGGHAELLETGVFRPVVKCDAESLYPSIMLAERISSSADTLHASLPMLQELTRRRLIAKTRARGTSGEERAVWEGLQSSFKVLINSFYGYLGFGAGLFNDFEAAARVTMAGQAVIKQTVARLRSAGATAIEVDTDGVYFVPPDGVAGVEEESALIERIGAELPEGIRLAHDGRFAAMLSLQLKNYALLHDDGKLTLKGSALRSRRLEPVFRDFIAESARGFMAEDQDNVRSSYFALAERIKGKRVPVSAIVQWAMINEETIGGQPRLQRLLARLPARVQSGERLQIYERDDGELALQEEYAGDENVGYLLKRLHDTAGRFRPLFESEGAFIAFFPPLSARTNLEMAKEQEVSTQLTMF